MTDPATLRRRPEADTLSGALQVLAERWWIIVLSVLVAVGATLALVSREADRYEATAKVQFGQSGLSQALGGGSGAGLSANDPQRDASTVLALASSSQVAEAARAALGTSRTASDLLGDVTVTAEPDANLIDLTASAADAGAAAQTANAFATAFVATRADANKARIDEGVASLRSELGRLRPKAPERVALNQQLSTLLALRAVENGGAEVVSQASAPGAPSSPTPRRDGVVAAILGLGAGLVLAFVADLLDRRLRRPADFEAAYGAPVLAALPSSAFRRGRRRSGGDPRWAGAYERYRILRARLATLVPDGDVRVVVVTSADQREGKTTVAANLARAAALSGRRVVLIDADFHRSDLARHYELPGRPAGLGAVLAGRARVESALVSGAPDPYHLDVLPSGAGSASAAELLGGPAMGNLLADLAVDASLVVIDAPPLLPVADAQILLANRAVDACLLVCRAKRTDRHDAERVRELLDGLRPRAVGLVVTGATDGPVSGYAPRATWQRAATGAGEGPLSVLEPGPPRRADGARRRVGVGGDPRESE